MIKSKLAIITINSLSSGCLSLCVANKIAMPIKIKQMDELGFVNET